MTRRFCDRCDKQTDQLTDVVIPSPIGATLKVELCNRCLEHLRYEVQQMPKAAMRAR